MAARTMTAAAEASPGTLAFSGRQRHTAPRNHGRVRVAPSHWRPGLLFEGEIRCFVP